MNIRYLTSCLGIVSVAVLILCILTVNPVWAQATEPSATTEPADLSAAVKDEPSDLNGDAESDDLVAINLKDVNIDKVIEFLTEITGKYIIKQNEVDATITVFSPNKVTKEQAFKLVCNALLLEHVAVIENDDTITLIPADILNEMPVDILSESSTKEPVGIVRKVIPVRYADPTEMLAIVKPLVSKNGSVTAHLPSRNLIVTDSAQRIASIEQIVARLDMLDIDERQIQITQLKYADAGTIAPIVKSVLNVLATKSQSTAKPAPGKPQRPPQNSKSSSSKSTAATLVEVLPYKTVNWLIVVAPKEILDQAKDLVTQLDKIQPPELELHVLPIQFADSGEMARELSSLSKRRPEKQLRDTIEITSHDRSNSLLVLCSQENFEMVKKLVQELDTEESVQTTTKTFPLEYADADDIAEQMNELYTGLTAGNNYRAYYYSRSRGGASTRFVAERRTNSIIAIARPSEFEKIAELIKQLDLPLDTDQVAPRIYHMKYVDATEMTTVLNDIFGNQTSSSRRRGGYYDYLYGGYNNEEIGRLYGKVRFVPEMTTNSIIVTTNNDDNYKIIDKFINELDQFNPEAANTMVVRLKNAKAEDLSDQLNTLFATAGTRAPQKSNSQQQQQRNTFYAWLYGSNNQQRGTEREISNLIGQVRVVPDVRTNSLTITTASQHFGLLRDLIAQLDIESPKVLISVRLIEVTTTDEQRIGTRISSDAGVFDSKDFDNGIFSTFGYSWDAIRRGDGTIKAGTVDISAIIEFLQRNANTRVLSEPTLTMNNNESANLFVGSEIPFITDSQTTPEGTKNQSFEYKNAGTTLNITPNINQDDKVVMKVQIEASQRRIGETLFGGEILDTRRFDTELAVNSGDTMVVGGIMRQTEADTIRRFPILGRIPILDLVFSKKDKIKETTELLAFITPRVLRTPDEDTAATENASQNADTINVWQPSSPVKTTK